MKYLLFATLLVLCGCDRKDAQIAADVRNKQWLESGGQVVGKLPDGREVKRIILEVPGMRNQHIFIVDGATAITKNQEVSSGKVTVQEVSATIILNGVTYRKVESENK